MVPLPAGAFVFRVVPNKPDFGIWSGIASGLANPTHHPGEISGRNHKKDPVIKVSHTYDLCDMYTICV